jgi:hypothetical protein
MVYGIKKRNTERKRREKKKEEERRKEKKKNCGVALSVSHSPDFVGSSKTKMQIPT